MVSRPAFDWHFSVDEGYGKGKCYKLNDTVTEDLDLNDETLECECFGEENRAQVYDQGFLMPCCKADTHTCVSQRYRMPACSSTGGGLMRTPCDHQRRLYPAGS
nr:ubiquitin carboxyl-terminal hydrolase 24-like [Aotus nancymaae]